MDTPPVTLIVKAPNQQFEDQTIKCELSWSIRKLKGYLSEVYPSNPSLEEQKLIYSGQLLNDAHILKDILRQYDGQETHTVHLVFTPKNKNDQNMASKTVQKKETKSEQHPIQSRVDATDGLRQRNFPLSTSQQNISNNMLPPAQYAPVMGITELSFNSTQSQSHYTPEQYALAHQMAMQNMMHQMYIQYLNHYANSAHSNVQTGNIFPTRMPYLQQTFDNRSFPSTMTPQPPAGGQNQNQNLYEPARQPEPQAQPQAPQRVQNDDEIENRDWLDILYTFSRLIVLLSLVYFYSSPGRCSIVILVMVLYYFYQNHQRNMRERQALENQQTATTANATINEPEDVDTETENSDDNTENVQPTEGSTNVISSTRDEATNNSVESESVSLSTTTAELEDNNRLPTVALLRTFVLSFFASLIPETPAV